MALKASSTSINLQSAPTRVISRREQFTFGFTIVELLIVVVVIAILAAITIVAYNGITNRTKVSAVQSAVSQANKKILSYAAINNDQYPASPSEAGLIDTPTTTYQVSSDNTTSPRTYCTTVMQNGLSYYVGTNGSMQSGICPGQSVINWNRAVGPPFTAGVADAATFRTAGPSMKLTPGTTAVIQGGPYAGTSTQTYTVTLWIKTDTGWDGSSTGSKIRFTDGTTGEYLSACGYNGVKTNWTKITCPRALSSTLTSINFSLANDGTTGNIWIDDLVMSISGT